MPVQIFCTLSVSTDRGPKNKREDRVECEQIDTVVENGDVMDVVSFASGCTLHGLNHIVTEGPWGVRRLIWVGAFLVSLFLFLSQVWERVAYYRLYPHLTAIDEMVASKMVFPAITFCNCNRFRPTQLSSSDISFLSPMIGFPEDGDAELVSEPSQDTDAGMSDMYEITDRSSHQLNEMMLGCKYQGRDCDIDDFVTVR